jgi:hypothetical protein
MAPVSKLGSAGGPFSSICLLNGTRIVYTKLYICRVPSCVLWSPQRLSFNLLLAVQLGTWGDCFFPSPTILLSALCQHLLFFK